MAEPDWDAAEEERLKRVMSRNKGPAASILSPRKPSTPSHSAATSSVANTSSPRPGGHSAEYDDLRKKRMNLTGVISTGIRELEAINAELAKLTAKKADLEALQARRQEQLDQIIHQMEAAEAAAASAPAHHPEVVNSSNAVVGRESPRTSSYEAAAPTVPAAVVKRVFEDVPVDEDQESARLMKTMTRPKTQATTPQRATVDPAKLEQQQAREAEERRRREELERKRREEEEIRKAKALEEQKAKEAELAAILSRGGTPVLFKYSECFDFDAECFLYADFTGWKPLPMVREGDHLDFTLTVPLPPGQTFFFYYQVNGKVELDRKRPTGLGNGILCNKITV